MNIYNEVDEIKIDIPRIPETLYFGKDSVKSLIKVADGIVYISTGNSPNVIQKGFFPIDPALVENYPGITAETLVTLLLTWAKKYEYRAAAGVAVVAGAQTIAFSSAMTDDDYVLVIWGDVGVDYSALTVNGFTATAVDAGTINYLAFLTS